jgi:hypothetical protein
VCLLIFNGGGFKGGILYIPLVFTIESFTLNLIFKRDFIGAAEALRSYYGSRHAPGYVFFLITEYIGLLIMVIYTIILLGNE